MAALGGVRKVIASSVGVPSRLVLTSVYLYAMMQPTGGYIRPPAGHSSADSLRSKLASTSLARRTMQFRMRDGSQIRSRIIDSAALLSVHVDGDYDVPGIDWPQVRSIIDIGAHVGAFTVWASMRAPAAHVFAVEPNPVTFELLTENVALNHLQGRVSTSNVALTKKTGPVQLESLEHPLGTRVARGLKSGITVNGLSLGDVLRAAEMPAIDVLKMDCEGMEYDVLADADPALLRPVMALACEFHPEPEHDVSELDISLHKAGFKVQRRDAALGVLWATR